jgi:hypothetical protein
VPQSPAGQQIRSAPILFWGGRAGIKSGAAAPLRQRKTGAFLCAGLEPEEEVDAPLSKKKNRRLREKVNTSKPPSDVTLARKA